MSSRTQIVCLHEGKRGGCDAVFINALIKALKPQWLRRDGSNFIRLVACGGRKNLIASMPKELKTCLTRGADTTLMVWADLDHDKADGDQLKKDFEDVARQAGIESEDFAKVVFAFAKDRIENWIEFLNTGSTDETREGPRELDNKKVANAAKRLAKICADNLTQSRLPASLSWSCDNWRILTNRMKQS